MVGGIHGRGACVAEGMLGRGVSGMWQGGMCGRGHAWQGGVHGRGHALFLITKEH